MSPVQPRFIALLPLLFFVALFLGSGIWYQLQGVDYAFYQLPAPIAVIPAIILGLFIHQRIFKNSNLEQGVSVFVSGMGDNKVITMCLIYLLAGAFASVAKATGGVDAVVHLGLQVIPSNMMVAGLFVISAVVATAMGTSMGTIGAIAPVAVAVVDTTGLSAPLVAGAVVGGAMFGDNLSFISDTTIAATKTQGAELKDKFKENLIFAIPSALVCIVLYLVIAPSAEVSETLNSDVNPLLALPYFVVILLAVSGVNVFVVLTLAVLLSAGMAVVFSDYQLSGLSGDIYSGFSNMQEIMLLSLFIGGLAELVNRQGGIEYVLKTVKRLMPKNSNNEVAIAGMSFLTNLAVANNTVAIIINGQSSKQLAQEDGIEAKRSASLMDIFSCIAQGIVPYGAQALLVAASFSISPIEVIPQVWYCFVLLAASIAVISVRNRKQKIAA